MNAIIAITISAIAFSFYPLLNSIALQYTSPFLLALCIQIATIVFSASYLLITQKHISQLRYLFHSFWKLDFEIKIIPFISGIGIYLGGIFFIFALSLMSKAGASLIMETWPILALIISPVVLRKKQSFSALDAVLILVSFIGLLFITAAESEKPLESFIQNPFFIFNSQDFSGSIGIMVAVLSAICLAGSSIARSYFVSILPVDFRIKFFKKKDTISEANFTYLLTYLFGFPLALISFLLMEDSIFIDINASLPIIMIGVIFVIVSTFYSYALLVADNANINLIWYISPVLAAVWLALSGYSQITPMLVLGGFLIIVSNIILISVSSKKKTEIADERKVL
jgi:drug/metabolite transporter (DMT)-like permease